MRTKWDLLGEWKDSSTYEIYTQINVFKIIFKIYNSNIDAILKEKITQILNNIMDK